MHYSNKISRFLLFVVLLLLLSCNENQKKNEPIAQKELIVNDCHVHIMSPALITYWKDLGIPFSKPDYYYSNSDSIIKINNAASINLIGMGYVFENPEYYQGDDRSEKLKEENNYLFELSKKYSANVIPFFTVDPLKNNAKNEIERCLKINRNSGLKLHFNTSQVYLTESEHLKKVKSIFELASENNVPILLHFDNGHPKFGKPDVEILVDSILPNIEPIRLTIAHFGTSGGFNEKTKTVIDAFIELYENDKIPKQHSIRFDISGVALDKDSDGVKRLREEEFSELAVLCNKLGYNKIQFGTDYPLYTSKDYIQILREKLKMTDMELDKIMIPNTLNDSLK